jgi:hypothetical protein
VRCLVRGMERVKSVTMQTTGGSKYNYTVFLRNKDKTQLYLILHLINKRNAHTGAEIAQWYSAGLRARKSGVRVPVGAGNCSPHDRVQTGSPGALSLGIKRPGREADHSPPYSAEVKNAWIYISSPQIRVHGVVLS